MGGSGSVIRLQHEAATEDFVKTLFTDKNKLNELFDDISKKQKFFSPDKITFEALAKYFHDETHPFFLRFVTDDAIIKAAYNYVRHQRKKEKAERSSRSFCNNDKTTQNPQAPHAPQLVKITVTGKNSSIGKASKSVSPVNEFNAVKRQSSHLGKDAGGKDKENKDEKGKESTESTMIKKSDFPFLMAVIYLFSHVYEVFVKIDGQNAKGVADNKISKDEFIASKDWIMNNCSSVVNSGEISDAEWRTAFNEVDGNGNGEVSFVEMCQFVVKFITDVQEFAKFGDEVEEEVEEPTDFHLIGDLEDVTEAMLKDPNRLSMYTSGNRMVEEAELLAKISRLKVEKFKTDLDASVGAMDLEEAAAEAVEAVEAMEAVEEETEIRLQLEISIK